MSVLPSPVPTHTHTFHTSVSHVNLPSACLFRVIRPTAQTSATAAASVECQICANPTSIHQVVNVLHAPAGEMSELCLILHCLLPRCSSLGKHITVAAPSFEAQKIKYVLHIFLFVFRNQKKKQKSALEKWCRRRRRMRRRSAWNVRLCPDSQANIILLQTFFLAFVCVCIWVGAHTAHTCYGCVVRTRRSEYNGPTYTIFIARRPNIFMVRSRQFAARSLPRIFRLTVSGGVIDERARNEYDGEEDRARLPE